MTHLVARAFWVREPGAGEIRPWRFRSRGRTTSSSAPSLRGQPGHRDARLLRPRAPGERVCRDARRRSRSGDLPGPVKYGYLSVGIVEAGPARLLGRTVFCLHPHQTRYVVPAAAVVPIPDGVPDHRAVLAGTLETAVNALWDAGPLVGDRVAVVGGGMVGLCAARLLAGSPACEVTLVDIEPVAGQRGRRARRPATPPGRGAAATGDLVVHASATVARACSPPSTCSATEGIVVDLSWYGDSRRHPAARRRVPLQAAHPSAPARSAPWHPGAGRRRTTPTGWRSHCGC